MECGYDLALIKLKINENEIQNQLQLEYGMEELHVKEGENICIIGYP